MSKTKTKRMVASFLLLCAMSGSKVLADPTGWAPGVDMGNAGNTFGTNIVFDEAHEFIGGTPWGGIINIGGNNTQDYTLTLDSASYTFKDIQSQDSGAAIYVASPNWAFSSPGQVVNINGTSLFENNRVGLSSVGRALGGAVYNTSTMNFNKYASFVGNIASNADGTLGSGGAVNTDGVMNFSTEGVNFSGNSAAIAGGALHNGSHGEVVINGGTFTNNTAGTSGGAIYNANDITLNASVADITFSGNRVAVGTGDERYNDVYLTSNGSMDLQGTSEDYSITFGGSIEGADGSQITSSAQNVILNGDNSDFAGTFTQTAGKTTVGTTGKFFGGANTHQIQGGSLVLAAADAISGSKLALSAGVDMYINADTTINGNVSGGGTINHATDRTTLTILGSNDAFTGTLNQQSGTLDIGDGTTVTTSLGKNNISGGTVNVKENATLTGTNTISGGNVNVQGTLAGANTTMSAGTVTLTDAILSGLNSMTGGTLNANSGSHLQGAMSVAGNADINIDASIVDGTMNIEGGTVDLSNGSSIAQGGSLDITGGQVNINQDITLGGTQGSITGAGKGGSLVMKGTNMTINGDMSGYEGSYKQDGGTIKIEKGSLFGGENNISNAQITMGNASSTADGSSLDLSNTQIKISNEGLGKLEEGTDGTINIEANGNQAILDGVIKSVEGDNSSITVSGDNSYLQIAGDGSGYKGSFSQSSGTTEILAGGTFFGGANTVTGGNFVFRDNANLSSSVTIANKDVNLVIGDAGGSFTLDGTGNTVTVNGGQFILEEVTLKDNLIDGGTEGSEANVNFNAYIGENGGFEKDGHYVIGSDGKAHNVTMEKGSVAQEGSVITINDNSTMNINADSMNDRDSSSGSPITGGSFNADLKSDGVEGGVNGTVNVSNKNTDRTHALNFTSDNSEFNGQFNHLGCMIKF